MDLNKEKIKDWQIADDGKIAILFEKGKLILIPPVALNSHIPFLHPRKLQVTPKGQYTLTLPKNIIQLLQWQTHDIIIFGFDHGKINLSKGVDHA